MYDLGDSARLTYSLRDAAGALTNATAVTLTITLPDNTTASPTVTNPPAATGVYVVDFTTTQAGRHVAKWTFTGGFVGTPVVLFDVFDVSAADPGYVVSLADAKAHLNMTSTTNDEELRAIVAATTRVVEHHVGPVVRRTVTQVFDWPGWRNQLALSKAPVLSLTSIALLSDGSSPMTVADIDVDAESGVMRVKSGACFPAGPWRITYVVGRADIPPNVRLAALIIIAHMWKTQRGSTARVDFGGDDVGTVTTGAGYLVPFRALALLEPNQQSWGFA